MLVGAHVRSGLFGNFIPLDRALEAVAARIEIDDSEVEARRINRRFCALDDRWTELAERRGIRDALATSKAASLLIRTLNRPLAQRLEWHELVSGVAIRDDQVGRQGLQWLVARQGASVQRSPGTNDRLEAMSEAPEQIGSTPARHQEIGFNVDELIDLLDREGIPHALGASDAPCVNDFADDEQNFGERLGSSEIPGTPAQVDMSEAALTDLAEDIQKPPKLAPMLTREQVLANAAKLRGPHVEAIYKALRACTNPLSHVSIFDALLDVVRPAPQKYGFDGIDTETRSLFWMDPVQGRVKFTLETMRGKMRTLLKERPKEERAASSVPQVPPRLWP